MTTTRLGLTALAGIAALGMAFATPASAEVTEDTPGAIKAVDLMAAWTNAGAPNGAFTYTDMSGNETDATFEQDVLPLMTTNGLWGPDTLACTSCHMGNTEQSLHEMDLSSYDGILKGGDVLSDPPGVPLLGNSEVGSTDYDWGHSKMMERLRDNRMPPGIEFDITEVNRDGPCMENGKPVPGEYGCDVTALGVLGDWVDDGAPNNDHFQNVILPMFTENNYWAPDTLACTACHMGNTEESLHEMDLSSYDGIMKGGDVLSDPPGVPLFGQSKVGATDYDWGNSKMHARLHNNRMPPGIEFDITEENRDGPIVAHGKF